MAKKPPKSGNGNGNDNQGDHVTPLHSVPKGETDDDARVRESVERLAGDFAKMLTSEMRGEEETFLDEFEKNLNPDDFTPKVADVVAEAVEKYGKDHHIELNKLNAEPALPKIQKLMVPEKVLEANKAYRQLVAEGHYSFVGEPQLFEKFRGYHSALDVDKLETAFRRIDTEVRGLDQVTREELIFNFVNAVLAGSDFGIFRSLTSSDYFVGVSQESRNMLFELVQFYTVAREAAHAQSKGRDLVAKIDAPAIFQVIDVPNRKGEYPLRVEYAHVARTIRPENYYLILYLIRCLAETLPSRTLKLLEQGAESDGLNLHITTINVRLMQPSKYLRNAFIALSRGYGSFESFFTNLNAFHTVLSNALNGQVRSARTLVNVFDSLGIDISKAVQASSKRILSDTEFSVF